MVSQAGTTYTYAGMDPIRFNQSNFSDPNNVTITGNPIVANNLSLTYFTSGTRGDQSGGRRHRTSLSRFPRIHSRSTSAMWAATH